VSVVSIHDTNSQSAACLANAALKEKDGNIVALSLV